MPDIYDWSPPGVSADSAAPTKPRNIYDWTPPGIESEPTPEEYAVRAQKAGIATGRSPAEQEQILRDKGYAPESVKGLVDQYKLEQAGRNLGRYSGGAQTALGGTLNEFKEHGIPFRSFFVNPQKDEQEAMKRFAEGKADDKDIQTLAVARRRHEDDERLKQAGIAGTVIGGLRAAPAIMGEYMTGARVAKSFGLVGTGLGSHAGRMAVITPFMPSTYLDSARQRNLENKREPYDPRGFGPELLHSYAQMLVLGNIFRMPPATGGFRAKAMDIGLKGVAAGGEIAVVDSYTNFADNFIPKAYKISHGYGTFENLLSGDVSAAGRKFAVDSLTMAAFAGMHSLADGLAAPEQVATRVVETFGKDLALLKRNGYTQDAAVKRLNAQIELFKEQVRDNPDAAEGLRDYARYRQEGFEPRDAYRKAFGPEAQLRKRGVEPGQITQPTTPGQLPPGSTQSPSGMRQLPPGRGPLPAIAPGLRQLRSFLSEEVSPKGEKTPPESPRGPAEAVMTDLYGKDRVIETEEGIAVDVGDRIINLKNTAANRVQIDFVGMTDANASAEAIGKGLQGGTKAMFDELKRITGQLRERGVEIEYSAEPRRHALNARGLQKAGYELVSRENIKKDDGSPGNQTKYVWRPKSETVKPTSKPQAPTPQKDSSLLPAEAKEGVLESTWKKAEAYLESLGEPPPPPANGMVRLYRGQKVGETPHENAFFSDARGLAGIAIPFARATGRQLIYVDVPEAVAKKGLETVGVTEGEYKVPAEYRDRVRVWGDATDNRAAKTDAARDELSAVFDRAGLTAPERWTITQFAAGRTMDAIGKEAGVTREAIRKRLLSVQKKVAAELGTAYEGSLFEKMFKGVDAVVPPKYEAELDAIMATAHPSLEKGTPKYESARRSEADDRGWLERPGARSGEGKKGFQMVDATGEPIEPTGKKYSGVTSDAGRVEALGREIEELTNQWVNAKTDSARAKIAEKIEIKAEARKAIESKGRTFTRRFLEEEGGYLDLQAIKDFLWKAADWFKWASSSGKTAPPGVVLDPTNVLPRPQDWGEYKRVVSDPQGVGRVPFLRWLFDPVRSDVTPESEVFVANQALKETGKDVAALWALQEKVADKLFMTDAAGEYTRGNGTKGRMSDDIEAEMRKPGSTGMSKEQANWVKDVWTPLLRDAQAMMKSQGIDSFLNEDGSTVKASDVAYFPRHAIGKVGVAGASAGPARGPRLYTSEAEGVAKLHPDGTPKEQIIYDPSAKSRVAKFISGLYSQIANHKTATDPALQGKTQRERFNEALIANGARLSALPAKARADAERELWERAGHPVWGREAFVQSSQAFAGKIYPKEVAEKIEKQFAQEQSQLIQGVEKVSAAAKGIMLGGDLSFGFIQLLPTMFRKPLVWAKAMKESVLSIFDRGRMTSYLENPENAAAARELTQLGSSVGRLQDFMRGLSEGEFATKIPVLGKVYEATGRAFGVAMDVAKIELWKAWKPANPAEYRAVAEVIDSMLLSGRMEGIGLSPKRVAAERLTLLATSYYRGGLQLIGTAFQRGEAGLRARQGLGAAIAGITIATVAAMKAAGLDDDEIESRLDPTRGKFLKVPVELEPGRTIEMGTSNILTSYVRLLGAGYDHFTNDKPIDTGADNNPILRWLRGKAAFSPRLAIDIWTGKDYFGERIQPSEAVVQSFEPLVVQQILHGKGGVFENPTPQTPKIENVADAVVSVFGFSSYPGSESDARRGVMDEEARKKFGRRYDDLSVPEQAVVVKLASRNPAMPVKQDANPSQIERAISRQAEGQARINRMVSPDSRKKLESLNESLPPYLAELSIDGTKVPLGDARIARYEQLLAEEYDRTIGGWNVETLKKMPAEVREDRLRGWLTQAKQRAQNRLIRESRQR